LIRTPLCEVFGIEHPVIQGAIGPWSSAGLAAAVSNAGGLGSIGTAANPPDRVRSQFEEIRELTDKPFAINHTARPFVEQYFQQSLEVEPAVISYAIGDPGDLPKRAQEAGAKFMQQIHTVEQAEMAAERGVDVIIAQGGEAGGFCGTVATLPLVPQVVDAVAPIPVVAAGGIADGRGLAAALALGAAGINIGTRFLASEEAAIDDEFKRAILDAASEEPEKVEIAAKALPKTEGSFATSPRALPTEFIERWRDRDPTEEELPEVGAEIRSALEQGRVHELVPFTGQTAGMIGDVKPAAEIVEFLVSEAEEALRSIQGAVGVGGG
jgi:enoyl-[acyl-carrier protein] reductase II